MKKKFLTTIGLILLTTTLIACGRGPEKATSASSKEKPVISSSTKEKASESTSTTESTPTNTVPSSGGSESENTIDSVATVPSDATEAPVEAKQITSHDDAVKYLIEALTEVNQDDTVYIDWGKGENAKGPYFDLKLASKSSQANGGSGTIGIYRVFANRTYELYPED